VRGGLTPGESLNICRLLEEAGINSIEVSRNNICETDIVAGKNEGFLAPFAEKLKSVVKIPIILTGGLRSVEHIRKLLYENGVEYFSLSRPLIKEPNLPNRWKDGDTKPSTCISCNECFSTNGHKCIFRNVNYF